MEKSQPSSWSHVKGHGLQGGPWCLRHLYCISIAHLLVHSPQWLFFTLLSLLKATRCPLLTLSLEVIKGVCSHTSTNCFYPYANIRMKYAAFLPVTRGDPFMLPPKATPPHVHSISQIPSQTFLLLPRPLSFPFPGLVPRPHQCYKFPCLKNHIQSTGISLSP